MRNGLGKFWAALMAPEAVFALNFRWPTSFLATHVQCGVWSVCRVRSLRHNFYGRNALIVTISLPTAIPLRSPDLALLLLWGLTEAGPAACPARIQIMFTAGAIIWANISRHFSAGLRVIKPVFDTMSRSLEEASATIGPRAGRLSGM